MSKEKLIVGATLVAFVVWIMARKSLTDTRGLRNNNPGNIKELPGDTTQWVGERATDDDPIFEEFEFPEYGIRAMGRVFRSFRARGIITLADIIYEWAPGFENQTEAYISAVRQRTGWPRDHVVVEEEGDYTTLAEAIIHHENGIQPYSLAFIEESIALA